MSRLPTGRVTSRFNWKDIIDAGGEVFSADPIEDAGADEIYLPSLHAFLVTDFRINDQEDGLGTDLTLDVDYEFAELNTKLTTEYGVEVYERIKILNVTYQTGDIWAFGKYAGDVNFAEYFNTLQAQIDALMSGTSAVLLGSKHTFFIYEDLSAYGLLAFTHASFSQANYQGLFNKIGHLFNDMHVSAGGADLSASGTLFYATPVPGYYERGGTQDTAVIDSTADVDDATELITLATADYDALHMTRGVLGTGADGVPVRLKLVSGALPTGLAEETTYYINFGTTPAISLHTTEALAIAGTSAIDLTDAVGTFKITQEGVYFDDAFQEFALESSSADGVTVNAIRRGDTPSATPFELDTVGVEAGNNGTLRTTNETRPKTFISFGYIKAEHITTSGEPVSALRYTEGWIQATSGWAGQTFNSNHSYNTDLSDLIVKFYVSEDGTESESVEPIFSVKEADSLVQGFSITQVDKDNISVKISLSGFRFVQNDGITLLLDAETTWYYKIVITKPNLVATYADTSFRKVYDIADATDYTFTLPDASTQLTEYIIKRRGSGAGKVTMATVSGQTIEGLTPSIWELEGEGEIVLFPYGGNWEVKEYNDSGNDTNEEWHKNKDGSLFMEFTVVSSASGATSIAIPHEAYSTLYYCVGSSNASTSTSDLTIKFSGRTTTNVDIVGTANGSYTAAGFAVIIHARWRT